MGPDWKVGVGIAAVCLGAVGLIAFAVHDSARQKAEFVEMCVKDRGERKRYECLALYDSSQPDTHVTNVQVHTPAVHR